MRILNPRIRPLRPSSDTLQDGTAIELFGQPHGRTLKDARVAKVTEKGNHELKVAVKVAEKVRTAGKANPKTSSKENLLGMVNWLGG